MYAERYTRASDPLTDQETESHGSCPWTLDPTSCCLVAEERGTRMVWKEEWRFRDCPWCGVKDAEMKKSAAWSARKATGAKRHWNAISCPRCAGVVLIEDRGPQESRPLPKSVEPSTARDEGVQHLPDDVRDYYQDARRVLDAGVPDAAAVQLRRTLEAATAHFGIDDGPLFKRIKELITQGLVTKSFGGVLDHVRAVGNIGAHASDARVDEATAHRIFDFTTQVLKNLFEIPAELKAAVGDGEEAGGTADS